jgi:guanylate kinase
MRELRARLERRAEDTAASIEARFQNARKEIERWRDYHYVVVNDDLTRTYDAVKTIVTAERLRARRIQAGVGQLVERLLTEQARAE